MEYFGNYNMAVYMAQHNLVVYLHQRFQRQVNKVGTRRNENNVISVDIIVILVKYLFNYSVMVGNIGCRQLNYIQFVCVKI